MCDIKKCKSCGAKRQSCQLQKGICNVCRANNGQPCLNTTDSIKALLDRLNCVKDNNKDIGISEGELNGLINQLNAALSAPCDFQEAVTKTQLLSPKITEVGC